jgi:addiction module HigA family antidote
MRAVPYPAPGSILEMDFLEPMKISRYRLAKEINVQQRRIDEIVSGSRAITADTGLRLSRFFGLSDGYWTKLQADYDTAMAKDELADVLDAIRPYALMMSAPTRSPKAVSKVNEKPSTYSALRKTRIKKKAAAKKVAKVKPAARRA